jgi:hypothetical protein
MTTTDPAPTIGLDAVAELAAQLRVDSVRSSTSAGSGHPTSSLSASDLLAVLVARHLSVQLQGRGPFPGYRNLVGLQRGRFSDRAVRRRVAPRAGQVAIDLRDQRTGGRGPRAGRGTSRAGIPGGHPSADGLARVGPRGRCPGRGHLRSDHDARAAIRLGALNHGRGDRPRCLGRIPLARAAF